MWCDLGKSVLRSNMWHFQFSLIEVLILERYILMKTPPESDQWFYRYEQRKDSQNNRKLIHSFFWLYLTINATDFRLIQLGRNTYRILPTSKTKKEDKKEMNTLSCQHKILHSHDLPFYLLISCCNCSYFILTLSSFSSVQGLFQFLFTHPLWQISCSIKEHRFYTIIIGIYSGPVLWGIKCFCIG